MVNNILITGHNGYIGSVLVPVLATADFRLTGLGNSRPTETGIYPHKIKEIVKDLREITIKDLGGIDAIVHLGGVSRVGQGLNRDEIFEINYHATLRFAHLAREAGVRRFIFSSSCLVYGPAGEKLVTEISPVNPINDYSETKARAEEALLDMAATDFSPVILRNALAYGVSPQMRFDLVLNNFTAWAFTSGKVVLRSDGTSFRPLIHVKDLCQAMALVLQAPKAKIHCEIFNCGRQGGNFRILDLAEMVIKKVPGAILEFAGDSKRDPNNIQVDFSKFQNTFPEFETQFTEADGILELVDLFKKRGLTLADLLVR